MQHGMKLRKISVYSLSSYEISVHITLNLNTSFIYNFNISLFVNYLVMELKGSTKTLLHYPLRLLSSNIIHSSSNFYPVPFFLFCLTYINYLVMELKGPLTKAYFIIHLGYYPLKQFFFSFTWETDSTLKLWCFFFILKTIVLFIKFLHKTVASLYSNFTVHNTNTVKT